MATDFSRTLSLLRQEKGISQRKAAAALGISQALLSHYENGIREPGLAFVARACDFYHVSADFLLGRTNSRDGSIIEAGELYDASDEKGTLKGSILATLQKKLVVNTTGGPSPPPATVSARRCTRCCGTCTGAAAATRTFSPPTRWISMPVRWTRPCCAAAHRTCGRWPGRSRCRS